MTAPSPDSPLPPASDPDTPPQTAASPQTAVAAPAEAAPPTRTVYGRPKRRWLRRTLVGIVSTILVLVLVVTGLVVWSVRRAFPQLGGELTLPGLDAPVTVYRDQYGIPQIYARTTTDLLRAEGYVHAQDRFWEMDFRRHITAGRLSELFGESQVRTDAFLRTLGWRRVAEQEWQHMSPQARDYLEAYAAGVNAWIDQNGGAEPSGDKSLEYTILGLTNGDYTVEPWSPVDTIAWLKAMAWDLRGNMTDEIDRAVLLASGLGVEQVEELYPQYPYVLNQPITPIGMSPHVPDEPPIDSAPADGMPQVAPLLAGLRQAVEGLPAMLGNNGLGIGSNSWVVGGEHTTTGEPLLANDPHLGPSMPGIWYQIGLHCRCAYNVAGFSFSGVPGVVIGHNQRIAWGFTNLGPDVTDLYVERVNGDQYFNGSAWQQLSTREEEILVAGGDPVTITVRSTPHGPLLSDRSQELLGIAGEPPVDVWPAQDPAVRPTPAPSLDPTAPGVPEAADDSDYAVALQWTALEPRPTTMEAVFELNQARDWDTFRAAAALFDVPSQNLIYADVEGNIGYQSPGHIPIRAAGDGRWPVPGWDPSYTWIGYIPFDLLPSVYNPPQGWIVTANQAVTGPWYDFLLTTDWSNGYRSQRIVDMLTERIADGPIDAEAIRQMQFDNRNGFAPTLVAALLDLTELPPAADLLRDWDFQQGAGSAAAALYSVFYRNLLARTFDELPADRRPDANDRWWLVLGNLLEESSSAWWDIHGTPTVEHRDDVLALALGEAIAELTRLQGGEPSAWRWGSLHTLTLTNATFGTSGIAPIEWLFNRGPFETSGGSDIVNATGWNPNEGYEVTWVPSMRMIVDLSDLDASRWVHLTGNSGHAFHPNYDDQFPLWQTGQNLPMRWDRDSIEAAATHTLTLRP